MGASREIHPTAIVAEGATLGAGVRIGPGAIVGPHVRLGDGVVLHAHAIVEGHTSVGAGAEIFPNAAVGLRPQDLKYDGAPTTLEIGARTVIRECATLQPGTTGGGGKTTVGADCLIMAYCHVAHDCHVGDRVIMANATQLAGHVIVEDAAILGGMTGVHQFSRIGRRSITGAQTRVMKDVPPFTTADGHPAQLFGLNIIGLRRDNFPKDSIRALKEAYKRIFVRPGAWAEVIAEVEASLGSVPEVAELCRFLKTSARGVTRAGFSKKDEPADEDQE
ncbi:MAG: acyl-ACP--UDP-N-acetylglucosamine O-acyltransferase [Myxococcota bacterium]